VRALHDAPSLVLPNLPRMADAARWATAAKEAAQERGKFLQAYRNNRSILYDVALEASPVAVAVRTLLENQPMWSGSATDLLGALGRHAPERAQRGRRRPQAGNAFSNELKRVAPDLLAINIHVDQSRTNTGRLITLRRVSLTTPAVIAEGNTARTGTGDV
jgi:hypothetical protein